MKKILIATSALVATAGIAHAEVSVSGKAIAGLVYNSEGVEKTRLLNKVNIEFNGSGESDGGLQFGFNTNHIVTNNGGSVDNDDTTVYMSGAFGKLSFGAVAEADEVAGLSDIGWDGLDVDDVAEALVGDELGDIMGMGIGHNVNYTYSTGPVTFSLSGKLATSHTATNDSYAAGVKYNFGTGYVGLGYGDHEFAGLRAASVVSVFGGATFDAIKVSALYSDARLKDGAGVKTDAQAYGFNASYTMDALTLSMGYGKAKFDANTMGIALKQQSFGVGAAYDLGGGASVSGGIARVESVGDENLSGAAARVGAKTKETRADFGVTFKF
ncbi:porin [Pseudorhodobacter sp.]|uniref:porin n=1 Tax=Pseudorhodobacter sp. TaxID=1934400 RepID=UPI002AFE53E7|nr:porin [Pseudorhodobacter sp.]